MQETENSKEKAILCARIADEKKAEDITVFYVENLTFITDYMIICTVTSPRHGKAIFEEILSTFKKKGVKPIGFEGVEEGHWLIMDYGDVVIHMFCEEFRSYYDLELLWGDAPHVDWVEAKL